MGGRRVNIVTPLMQKVSNSEQPVAFLRRILHAEKAVRQRVADSPWWAGVG